MGKPPPRRAPGGLQKGGPGPIFWVPQIGEGGPGFLGAQTNLERERGGLNRGEPFCPKKKKKSGLKGVKVGPTTPRGVFWFWGGRTIPPPHLLLMTRPLKGGHNIPPIIYPQKEGPHYKKHPLCVEAAGPARF